MNQELVTYKTESAKYKQETERLAQQAVAEQQEKKNLQLKLQQASQQAAHTQNEYEQLKNTLAKAEKEKAEAEERAEKERVQREADINKISLQMEQQRLQLQARGQGGLGGVEANSQMSASTAAAAGGVFSYLSLGLSSLSNTLGGYVWSETWEAVLKLEQFQLLEIRGESMNSPVRRAIDKDNIHYALKLVPLPAYKKVNKPAETLTDSQVKQQLALENVLTEEFRLNTNFYSSFRESMLLSKLDHPYITKLEGVVKATDSIYSVMPFYGNDLQYLSYGTLDSFLSANQIQVIFHRVISALCYLHSCEVVHRNLSPSSILVQLSEEQILHMKKVLSVRLASFGAAKSLNFTSDSIRLRGGAYLQPEFEKQKDFNRKLHSWAPELVSIECEKSYVTPNFDWKKCDVWALGLTIINTIRCGDLLFHSTKALSHLQNILKIHELRPKNLEELESPEFPIKGRWSSKAETTLRSVLSHTPPGSKDRISFLDSNPKLASSCIDLLSKMMAWDPRDRPSFKECLDHEFFSGLPLHPFTITPVEFGASLTDNFLMPFVRKLISQEKATMG